MLRRLVLIPVIMLYLWCTWMWWSWIVPKLWGLHCAGDYPMVQFVAVLVIGLAFPLGVIMFTAKFVES